MDLLRGARKDRMGRQEPDELLILSVFYVPQRPIGHYSSSLLSFYSYERILLVHKYY